MNFKKGDSVKYKYENDLVINNNNIYTIKEIYRSIGMIDLVDINNKLFCEQLEKVENIKN